MIGRFFSNNKVNMKKEIKDTIDRNACGRKIRIAEKKTYGITRNNNALDCGNKPKSTPNETAIALPPPQGANAWPATGAATINAIQKEFNGIRYLAISTGTAPLASSNNNDSIPTERPPNFNAFAVPGFPSSLHLAMST